VALFKGVVYGDNNPIEARVDIVQAADSKSLGPYFSNAGTGKYLVTLQPGANYRIRISAEGYAPLEEGICTENLKDYGELRKDFYLYSTAFSGEKKADSTQLEFNTPAVIAAANPLNPSASTPTSTSASNQNSTTEDPKTGVPAVVAAVPVAVAAVPVTEATKDPEKNTEPAVVKTKTETEEKSEPGVAAKKSSSTPCDNLPDMGIIKGKSLNDPGNYQLMLNIAGNYCADNLVFKVQIGAYRNPNKFQYSNLKSLGKVVSDNYPDGIVRFELGQFKTIKDAEVVRQKAISRGQADAWLVAFIDGKRYTLEDLIMLDFLGKTIN